MVIASSSSAGPTADLSDFTETLALFAPVERAPEAIAAERPVGLALVLAHRPERVHKTKKFLPPLAFLIRDRPDLALYQTLVTDPEPSLTIYKDGHEVLRVNPKSGSVKDRILAIVGVIGYCDGYPDEQSLTHYFTPVDYVDIFADIEAYTSSQRDFIANTANVSAIIWHAFLNAQRPINWAGFYFARPLATPTPSETHVLVLGPFQGKKACHTIHYDTGVCGAAARLKTTQRIADVHQFEGHIACDSASESEIVVPLLSDTGEVVAVLDMDCPEKNGFTKEDERQLGRIARLLAARSDWHNLRLPYAEL